MTTKKVAATRKKVRAKKIKTSAKTGTMVRKKTAKKSTTVKRTSAQKSKGGSGAKSLVGKAAPGVRLPATGGRELALSDFAGKIVVLYFYPKDNTPGCTLEGQDFKRLKAGFDAKGAVILGVSRDSMKSHENFKNKCGFPFELLVDADEVLCRGFDVIQMKNLYGHKFEGIERSTFVIDQSGTVAKEWRKVRVDGHADEVLAFVREM